MVLLSSNLLNRVPKRKQKNGVDVNHAIHVLHRIEHGRHPIRARKISSVYMTRYCLKHEVLEFLFKTRLAVRQIAMSNLWSNHHQGGAYSEGEVAMTSFVMTALLECNCPGVVSFMLALTMDVLGQSEIIFVQSRVLISLALPPPIVLCLFF